MRQTKWMSVIALIALAASFRVLPHPANFTPIGAIALFSGAYIADRRWAFAIPAAALAVSDLLMGGYGVGLMAAVYAAFAAEVAIGMLLRERRGPGRIAGATLAGSVLFFAVTNFAVWALGAYPRSAAGLGACYTAAIPFFERTLAGDFLYTGVLFGLMAAAERKLPAFRNEAA